MNQQTKELRKIIKPLIVQGKTCDEIVAAVNATGLKTKLGGAYKKDAIQHLIAYHGWGRPAGMKRKRKSYKKLAKTNTKTTPNKETTDAEALRYLILHSNLSDSKKINLLKGIEK